MTSVPSLQGVNGAPKSVVHPDRLDRKTAIIVFLTFAGAYFCSTLLRAITATLSPVLTQEFSLHSRDLGLLAGGYFLGFAAIQLPLGKWLDRYGPRNVILCFLSLAVLGCLAFSMAGSFAGLLGARVLLGMGVGACLMAPLTGYRRWFDAPALLRANSWMLMSGSLGMLASTLPVQWLLPVLGWRALFWVLAVMLLVAMGAIAVLVPGWAAAMKSAADDSVKTAQQASGSYAEVWESRYFRKMVPMGFFNYAGLVAVQTLWAGPWMIKVAGYTPLEAATGLFCLNAGMLVSFLSWGVVNPALQARGWHTDRLVKWGAPVAMLLLAVNILGGAHTGWLGWTLYCMSTSVMGLMQPAVGMAFPSSVAGRALSAYNLAIFGGVFVVQWGIGLLIDSFTALGWSYMAGFQGAMAVYLCCCIASYVYFLLVKVDNSPQ